ncbi:DNA topoisomerase IB [Yoonia sp.]|uniref:DNA topoisomerase IB n=1 Tax=Yoonia sp. TaxID=2212373 RepID=UPI00391CA30A
MPDSSTLKEAGLIYVSDTMPGIRRIGAGRGFYYRDGTNQKVTDHATLTRIRNLAIPPAWSDVWISPDPEGHLQATGRDVRHRKHYRYHPAWTDLRDAAKFAGLVAFARRLPALRRTVSKDMQCPALSRERVLATVVRLLERTLIRIGNDIYAEENKSYGLTTLRRRHLDLQGTQLRFRFKGKSGQEWSLQIADRRIANTVRQLQELPGQRLFRYLDEDGTACDIHSHDVNAYLQAAMGDQFTSKHFRTWGATVQAAAMLEDTPTPEANREQARILNQVLDDVAGNLGHTRTVCRNCYVHPAVITQWEKGKLGQQMKATRHHVDKPRRGLTRDEEVVLRWLRNRKPADAATDA